MNSAADGELPPPRSNGAEATAGARAAHSSVSQRLRPWMASAPVPHCRFEAGESIRPLVLWLADCSRWNAKLVTP